MDDPTNNIHYSVKTVTTKYFFIGFDGEKRYDDSKTETETIQEDITNKKECWTGFTHVFLESSLNNNNLLRPEGYGNFFRWTCVYDSSVYMYEFIHWTRTEQTERFVVKSNTLYKLITRDTNCTSAVSKFGDEITTPTNTEQSEINISDYTNTDYWTSSETVKIIDGKEHYYKKYVCKYKYEDGSDVIIEGVEYGKVYIYGYKDGLYDVVIRFVDYCDSHTRIILPSKDEMEIPPYSEFKGWEPTTGIMKDGDQYIILCSGIGKTEYHAVFTGNTYNIYFRGLVQGLSENLDDYRTINKKIYYAYGEKVIIPENPDFIRDENFPEASKVRFLKWWKRDIDNKPNPNTEDYTVEPICNGHHITYYAIYDEAVKPIKLWFYDWKYATITTVDYYIGANYTKLLASVGHEPYLRDVESELSTKPYRTDMPWVGWYYIDGNKNKVFLDGVNPINKNYNKIYQYYANAEFNVVFYGKDDVVLSQQVVRYGHDLMMVTAPNFDGENHKFVKWDKPIEQIVTEDAEYHALYECEYRTIKFIGMGGEVLYSFTRFDGETFELPPLDEIKALFLQKYKNYEFLGWDSEVQTTVNGDAIYNAEYKFLGYLLNWYDIQNDELVLLKSERVGLNSTPVPPDIPKFKNLDENGNVGQYTSIFDCWYYTDTDIWFSGTRYTLPKKINRSYNKIFPQYTSCYKDCSMYNMGEKHYDRVYKTDETVTIDVGSVSDGFDVSFKVRGESTPNNSINCALNPCYDYSKNSLIVNSTPKPKYHNGIFVNKYGTIIIKTNNVTDTSVIDSETGEYRVSNYILNKLTFIFEDGNKTFPIYKGSWSGGNYVYESSGFYIRYTGSSSLNRVWWDDGEKSICEVADYDYGWISDEMNGTKGVRRATYDSITFNGKFDTIGWTPRIEEAMWVTGIDATFVYNDKDVIGEEYEYTIELQGTDESEWNVVSPTEKSYKRIVKTYYFVDYGDESRLKFEQYVLSEPMGQRYVSAAFETPISSQVGKGVYKLSNKLIYTIGRWKAKYVDNSYNPPQIVKEEFVDFGKSPTTPPIPSNRTGENGMIITYGSWDEIGTNAPNYDDVTSYIQYTVEYPICTVIWYNNYTNEQVAVRQVPMNEDIP